MKILCAHGQYNYGDPSRGLGPEFKAFIPALRELGHDVVHFETLDRTRFRDFADLNQAFLRTVEEVEPDLVFTVLLHYEIWVQTIQLLSNDLSIATLNWATDDSWRFDSFSRFMAPYFDAVSTTDIGAFRRYLEAGITNVFPTQWAADPQRMHTPRDADRCSIEVSFVGAAYGKRKEIVGKLEALGLRIECFGYGWANGPLADTEVEDIFNRSKLSINFSGPSRGRGHRDTKQIKARIFEVAGAGGCLLTERAPRIDEYYREDDEVLVFESLEDLVEKAHHYLARPDDRDAVAWAGYERTRAEHTYLHRFPSLIDFAISRASLRERKGEEAPFETVIVSHRVTSSMRVLRRVLVAILRPFLSSSRAERGARRLVFEISWRLVGEKTYRASGWPGRMFYDVS